MQANLDVVRNNFQLVAGDPKAPLISTFPKSFLECNIFHNRFRPTAIFRNAFWGEPSAAAEATEDWHEESDEDAEDEEGQPHLNKPALRREMCVWRAHFLASRALPPRNKVENVW